MNAKTLKALKESIQHWQRLSTGKRRPKEGIFGDACPLCKIFSTGIPIKYACDGCPVMKKTGKRQCSGSPWPEVHNIWCLLPSGRDYSSKKFQAAAGKELAFLKSLLPKGKK